MRQHDLLLLFLQTILTSLVIGRSGPWLKKFQNCDTNFDYDGKFDVNISAKGNVQYMNATIIAKSPYDNNLSSNVTVEILAGKKYVHLLSVTERKSCDAMHKYFGEFAYDLERQAQLLPGLCPIPKGRYQVHNVLLNYQKITTLSTFPFGTLRFKLVSFRKEKPIYTCLIFEAENYGYF